MVKFSWLLFLACLGTSYSTIWFPGYQSSSIPRSDSIVPIASPPSNSSVSKSSSTKVNITSVDGITFQVENNLDWQKRVDGVLARGVLQLALQLDLTEGHSTSNNVVFSPISIASALALVLLGAGGRTYIEVAQLMGLASGVEIAGNSRLVHQQFGLLLDRFNSTSLMGFQLSAASALFIQESFHINHEFVQASRDVYHSDVISLDFQKRNYEAQWVLNKWVADRTESKIKSLLESPPPPETRVIIASALYFNGAWQFPFPIEFSLRRPFFVSNSDVVEVTMMTNSMEVPYAVNRALGCRILGLPYEHGTAVMYIILPDEGGEVALRQLEARLTVPVLDALISSAAVTPVIASIPRMRLENTLSLKTTLQQLGLGSLFDPAAANLTGISTAEGLYADDVVHKVEVDVTETGTVAAAATAVSISRDGSSPVFRVDRPFLFFIRHEPSNLILFWGSVIRPTPNTPSKQYMRKLRNNRLS